MMEVVNLDRCDVNEPVWKAYESFLNARWAEAGLVGRPPWWSNSQPPADYAPRLWIVHRLVATENGRVIGHARVSTRKAGSVNYSEYSSFIGGGRHIPTSMGGEVYVLKDDRRRGVAICLLAALRDLMVRSSKTSLTLATESPEGHALLAGIGATETLCGYDQRLCVDDVDWRQIEEWERSLVQGEGLTFECYTGRVPANSLGELTAHMTALFTDVPGAGVSAPPIRVEVSDYEDWYRQLDRAEGTHNVVLIRAPSGAIAGVCETALHDARSEAAAQNLTAVARPFRGRGVAKALKARMLCQLRTVHPHLRTITTFNAASNKPILALNEALGFRIYCRSSAFSVGIETLTNWLSTRDQLLNGAEPAN